MENTTDMVVLTQAQYAEMKETIARLETLVNYYEGQIRLLKSQRFGQSSEVSGQLGLFDEVENTADPSCLLRVESAPMVDECFP